MKRKWHRNGFTLLELLVVIAIISLLASIVLASLSSARKKVRDVRRLSDMQQMQVALEGYYDRFNAYPDSDAAGCGSWDTPGNGSFLAPLVSNGFLPTDIKDPSVNDACGNYRYYRYVAHTYDCDIKKGQFYVLVINDMETSGNPYPGSPGFSCIGRNWQDDFEWVTGRFENP